MDTWAQGRGNTTIEEVVNAIAQWIPAADGITISGGEPFDQPDALFELLAKATVANRSGHPRLHRISVDQSQRNGRLRRPDLIDALVTGPFDINESQTLALRGSDNQELHLMTARGRARFASFRTPGHRAGPSRRRHVR